MYVCIYIYIYTYTYPLCPSMHDHAYLATFSAKILGPHENSPSGDFHPKSMRGLRHRVKATNIQYLGTIPFFDHPFKV